MALERAKGGGVGQAAGEAGPPEPATFDAFFFDHRIEHSLANLAVHSSEAEFMLPHILVNQFFVAVGFSKLAGSLLEHFDVGQCVSTAICFGR